MPKLTRSTLDCFVVVRDVCPYLIVCSWAKYLLSPNGNMTYTVWGLGRYQMTQSPELDLDVSAKDDSCLWLTNYM